VAVPAVPAVKTTPERIRQLGEAELELDPSGRQRIIAAPIDRLLNAGFLTQREHDAGDKLRADTYMAAVDPAAMTVDWARGGSGFSPRVPSVFSTQEIADARIRHRRLRRAINGVVWDVLWLGVVQERALEHLGHAIFNVRDPREAVIAGRAGLRIALGSLADFYERSP
jgi:hypothetical protein